MTERFEVETFAYPEDMPGDDPQRTAVELNELLQGTGLQVMRTFGVDSGYYLVRYEEGSGE